MAKKYRSDALGAIHGTMEALHEVGAIDEQIMREFDDACLAPMQARPTGTIDAFLHTLNDKVRTEQPLTIEEMNEVAAAGLVSFHAEDHERPPQRHAVGKSLDYEHNQP